jgi:hypothetical protein
LYLGLAADINRLSARLGDSSNLILDHDLDTYYLMDATLIKLPEIQKILSEIRLISQKNSLRQDGRVKIGIGDVTGTWMRKWRFNDYGSNGGADFPCLQ